MLIKICGMKYPQNIKEVAFLKPDMLGFIFYKKSSRYIGEDFDFTLLDDIREELATVAVFVNEELDKAEEIAARYGFEYVQLHGDESPDFCKVLDQQGVKVIKAFSMHAAFDFEHLNDYAPCCSYFLFDTKGVNRGGNGMTFDWSVLEKYKLSVPFILSGGLGAENVSEAISLSYPHLMGLDFNSKIEQEPGLKSVEKARQIINHVKHNKP
jgi:phosphoribosylanthranilate isomerase